MLRHVVLATVGYTLIVFPLAMIWHVGLFEEAYHAFGYFDGEPNIPLGLVTILSQGILLSIMYPMFAAHTPSFSQAARFCVLVGAFFWTSHVLALVAKQNVPDAMRFVVMESLYLGLQFGAFAIVLGFVFRDAD
ncbi:MAG: hypothetical protein AAFQ58_07530 [Pseudomonadota bacterium]